MKNSIPILIVIMLFFSSCIGTNYYLQMTPEKMELLELGMNKNEVTNILGKSYTISDKYAENGNDYTILSYRERIYDDEFFLFVFENDKLVRWYRELTPKVKAVE